MTWLSEAQDIAAQHPTVVALKDRAHWHRQMGKDFLNKSVQSMAQHDSEAASLDATANKVANELVASAGVKAGEYLSYSCTHDHHRGIVVSVETDKGWNPTPLWVQFPAK